MPKAAARHKVYDDNGTARMSPKGSSKVSPRKHSEATDRTEDDDEYSNGGDSRGSLKMNMEEAATAILQKSNDEIEA